MASMPHSSDDDLYSHIESSDVLTELYYAQLRRPRTATNSHYRPHSVVVAEKEAQNSNPLSRSRSFYKSRASAVTRPLSIMAFGTKKAPPEPQSSPASIPKAEDRPPAPGRLAPSLKGKKKAHNIPETGRNTTTSPSTSYFDTPRQTQPHHHKFQIETSEKSFTERLFWSQKNGQMFLHPYGAQNVPYVVAYDTILMQSDHHTSSLLQRLHNNSSPSFHDYGKKPPGSVLDLGCGDMHWAIHHAAVAWKKTHITAFDLVNAPAMLRADDDRPIPENVHFVQGDFINYPLPFPSDTFNMVRMANLGLAIPYEKWNFVLGEVNRVLRTGGRVEIIDDHIFFPYGPAPEPEHSIWHHSFTSLPSASTLDMSDSDEGGASNFESSQQHPIRPTRPLPAPPLSPVDHHSRVEEWESMAALSKDLENVFGAMLTQQYGIHPRPHEFLLNVLGTTFGRENAKKLRTLHLKLAPNSELLKEEDRASLDSTDSGYASAVNPKKTDRKQEKEKRAEEKMTLRVKKAAVRVDDLVSSIFLDVAPPARAPSPMHYRTPSWASSQSQLTDISSKAADRLGIDLGRLSPAPGHRLLISPCDSSQSPGLVLHPSTFIPFSPTELEMHACRHMHTLLGCKSALIEYLTRQADKDGNDVVTPSDVEDALWKYECFRRARFNWPLDPPDDLEFNCKSSRASSLRGRLRTNSGPKHPTLSVHSHSGEELTHVRTFRIFEATKVQILR